jgi:hypothetical protein
MVVAIESPRFSSIEAAELVKLGLYDKIEIINEEGMKYEPGKALPSQARGESALTFQNSSRAVP